MYTTCLFCHANLGRNEAIEAFPVGRRLAYDAAKGRLWVVCRKCERWNLTPLEARWEAIDEAERLFRGTRLRAQTENVGLARLGDGTELVRIGAPLRPEFAAWRYGDQFGRRRKRQALLATAGVAAGVTAVGAVVAAGVAAGIGVGGFGWGAGRLFNALVHGRGGTVVARVPTAALGVVAVRRRDLGRTSVVAAGHGPFALYIARGGDDDPTRRTDIRLEGEDAVRAASVLLPAANRFGGSRLDVSDAVGRIEQAGGPEALVAGTGRGPAVVRSRPEEVRRSRWASDDGDAWRRTGLFAVGKVDRLALEMALHEEQERRAIEGDLAPLEAAWREAEEIAAIADNLLLPEGVDAKLGALRARRAGPPESLGREDR